MVIFISEVGDNLKMTEEVKHLLQKLTSSNTKEVFENVSIIANRCSDLDFVQEIISRNGINSLMKILNESVEDDCKYKACIALGKMAKFVGDLIRPVSSILKFLYETKNVNCQVSALFTLVVLGTRSEAKDDIIEGNGIRCIAKFLNSSDCKVLQYSIRAIAILTKNCSLLCAKQLVIQDSFKVLVELNSDTDESTRKLALTVLYNLSSHEEIRPELLNAGVVNLFLGILSSWESFEMNKLAVLGLLYFKDKIDLWSHDGIHGLKSSDILSVLIKILEKVIENYKCSSIGKFSTKDEYLEDSDEEVTPENDTSKNKQCNNAINADTKITKLKDDTSKRVKNISLQTANKLEYPSSSSSSIRRKCSSVSNPNKIFNPVKKHSLSPDFSPQPELYISPQKKIKPDVINKVGPVNIESKASNELKSPNSSNSKQELDDAFEKFRIDHFISPFICHTLTYHITNKFCFSILIDYLCFIHNHSPKVVEVLVMSIQRPNLFKKLIENGFFTELEDKMTSNYSCTHKQGESEQIYSYLINLSKKIATTHDCTRNISEILLTSEKLGKLNALCAMAEFITEKSSLHRLLFKDEGLSMLFNFLSDSNITVRRRAMVSLGKAYQSLKKGLNREMCGCNTELPNYTACNKRELCDCVYEEINLDVTFSVDSGGKVLGNREKLCENSDYFAALLKGNFMERDAEIVSIPGISEASLTMIFHFLHGCFSETSCYYITCMPLSVMLQLHSDCDRLLLTNIKTYIESRLYHFTYSSNSPLIYKQGQIGNCPRLSENALDVALSTNTCNITFFLIFKELLTFESTFKLFPNIEIMFKNLFIESDICL